MKVDAVIHLCLKYMDSFEIFYPLPHELPASCKGSTTTSDPNLSWCCSGCTDFGYVCLVDILYMYNNNNYGESISNLL